MKKLLLFALFAFLLSCEKNSDRQGEGNLINLTEELAGDHCFSGGYKIDIGIDTNENGILNKDEVKSTHYVCNGNAGSGSVSGSNTPNSLFNIIAEPIGINCTAGGYNIEVGIDTDRNGQLDENEVESTKYICNGTAGLDGLSSIFNIVDEPAGVNCVSGGHIIEIGIDGDEDGLLDIEEIESTQYICNGSKGSNGLNSLFNLKAEPVGDNCPAGGQNLEVGIDTNGNGILDADEIQSTQYICDGFYDKQIRFDFNWDLHVIFTNSSDGEFSNIGNTLINFNINNYIGLDSIAFGAIIATPNVNNKCIAELYNITDHKAIEGSQISTNETSPVFVFTSTNFLKNMPDKNIDLGVRVRSEFTGRGMVRMEKPQLYLYRSE